MADLRLPGAGWAAIAGGRTLLESGPGELAFPAERTSMSPCKVTAAALFAVFVTSPASLGAERALMTELLEKL